MSDTISITSKGQDERYLEDIGRTPEDSAIEHLRRIGIPRSRLFQRQSLRTYFKGGKFAQKQRREAPDAIVTYGVEDSHAIYAIADAWANCRGTRRSGVRNYHREFRVALRHRYTHTYRRGVEGRSTRVRKSREAHRGAEGQRANGRGR